MQYKLLAMTALLAAFVTADDVPTIPACSNDCFVKAIDMTICGRVDYACQCTTGKDIIDKNVRPCLLQSTCTTSDVDAINNAVAAICKDALAGNSTSADASASGSASGSQETGSAGSRAAAEASSAAASAASAVNSAATTALPGAGNTVRVGGAVLGLSLAAALVI